MNNKKKFLLASILSTSLIAGCGGGGTSSDGGQMSNLTFQGTYQTGINTGNITIIVRPNNTANISIMNVVQAGVDCLPTAIEADVTVNNGTTIGVGIAPIPGFPATGANGAATSIGVTFPSNGGSGDLTLSAPTPCVSSVGTVSLSRN